MKSSLEQRLRTRAAIPLVILAIGLPIAGRAIPDTVVNSVQAVALQAVDLKVAYHLSLHAVALILGVYLMAISTRAFLRDGRTRVLLLGIAFSLIAIREAVDMTDLVLFHGQQVLPFTDIEVAHLIDFLIITLFSAGTLKS